MPPRSHGSGVAPRVGHSSGAANAALSCHPQRRAGGPDAPAGGGHSEVDYSKAAYNPAMSAESRTRAAVDRGAVTPSTLRAIGGGTVASASTAMFHGHRAGSHGFGGARSGPPRVTLNSPRTALCRPAPSAKTWSFV